MKTGVIQNKQHTSWFSKLHLTMTKSGTTAVSQGSTKPRLKKHIELNTKLQENAKNEFETEFFKSMSNSFVGNTMENIRNCADVWLVSNRKRTLKLSAKPNLKHLTIFDEKLATTKSELSWCSISQSIVEWASLTSAGLWCMIFTITKSRLRMEIVRSFYS